MGEQLYFKKRAHRCDKGTHAQRSGNLLNSIVRIIKANDTGEGGNLHQTGVSTVLKASESRDQKILKRTRLIQKAKTTEK